MTTKGNQEDQMPDAVPDAVPAVPSQPAMPDMPAMPDTTAMPVTPIVPAVVPPGLSSVPISPSDPKAARSDYSRLRGSAAAVDSSMPAVATQDKAKKKDTRRGASEGPGRKGRSRSPFGGTEHKSDWNDLLQVTQQQVALLTARVTMLEGQQQSGRDAIASFADRLV